MNFMHRIMRINKGENMLNKKLFLSFLLILTGCSANSIKHGAETVKVTNIEPDKECIRLGDITGSQGNFFTGEWTSNRNLETGARNDLKNRAYDMGGNVVVILTQRPGMTGGGTSIFGSLQQTNVTISGTVYKCP